MTTSNNITNKSNKNTKLAIEQAAIDCFDQFTIKKTSIEDICNKASVSRPTFYRFFKNKDDLVLRMGGKESARLSSNIANFLDSKKDISDVFVDATFYIIKECQNSKIVNFMLNSENLETTLSVVFTHTETLSNQNQGWSALYDEARSQGRLRVDADDMDITEWLSIIRVLFFIFSNSVNPSDEKIKKMIRNYVIPSIIS